MGNPSDAVDSVPYSYNYLKMRSEYVVCYNCDRGIPGWAAWNLDKAWLCNVPRKNTFRPVSACSEG